MFESFAPKVSILFVSIDKPSGIVKNSEAAFGAPAKITDPTISKVSPTLLFLPS